MRWLPPLIVAFVTFDRFTTNVSFVSLSRSPTTATSTV